MKNFVAEPVIRQLNSSYSKSNVEDVTGGGCARPTFDVDRSKSLLDKEQVQRLLDVLDEEFEVHGRGNFPTLKIQPGRLIRLLATRVQAKNLSIKRVKMNGGAASYVIADSRATLTCGQKDHRENYLAPDIPVDDRFSDLDLIFDVDLEPAENFDLLKQCALESLIDFLPELANRSKITHSVMQEAYVKKMVKIVGCSPYKHTRRPHQSNARPVDLWSLITLNNNQGRCIELKFVDQMRRQFEFSVDSFQIHLDRLLFLNTSSSMRSSLMTSPSMTLSLASAGDRCETNDVSLARRRSSASGDLMTSRRSSKLAGGDDCDGPSTRRRRRSSTSDVVRQDKILAASDGKLSATKIDDRCETTVGDVDNDEWSTRRRCFENGDVVVVAESAYGDFSVASDHLRRKLIATVQPELIRGGGLLKYVHLLVKGYRPAEDENVDAESSSDVDRTTTTASRRRDGGETVRKLERYMCSRFFIDFGRLDQQERKLRAYLDDHLRSYSNQAKYDFLVLLYRVIDESTVCLMSHERHQTLNLLYQLMSEEEPAPRSFAPAPSPVVAPSPSVASCSSFHHRNCYKGPQPATHKSQMFAFQPQSRMAFVPAHSTTKTSAPTFFYVPQQNHQPQRPPAGATLWIHVV